MAPQTSTTMTPQSLVDHAVATSMADDCIVIVHDSTSANLRWANNTLTTNGVMHGISVTVISFVRTAEGTATGSVTGSATSQAQVTSLVEAADAAARAASPAEDANDLVRDAVADHWDDAPVPTDIHVYDTFAPALGEAFRRSSSSGRVLYGFVNHEVTTTYVGSTTGLRLRHVQPTGHYACTGKTADLSQSAWVGGATRDFADVDALGKSEGKSWVWHGADCLKPAYERCLVALSRGGSDADVTREFDLTTKQWVKDGFFRPEAKGALGWIDRDTVYVTTDFGPDAQGISAMTTSGYPRIARQWRRGTPLSAASLVYAGQPTDLAISAYHDATPGFERDFVHRALDFYRDELYLRGGNGVLIKLDVPDSMIKSVHREWLLLQLRDPWTRDGRTYAAGSLLATRFDDFIGGQHAFDVLFEPTPATSLESFAWTRHHLVLNVLDDVKNRLSVLTPAGGGWKREDFTGAPAFGTLGVSAVDDDDSDAVWLSATDYRTAMVFLKTQMKARSLFERAGDRTTAARIF